MAKSHASAWASDAPTPAQIKEFFAQVESGKVTKSNLQKFLRGDTPKGEGVKLLIEWQLFYKKHFDLDKDFSTLRIPERKEGFDRLIVVAEGMTPEKIFARMKSLMPASKYWNNLNEITSDRKADKDYAIWVRDRVEADEELKNKSANNLKKEGIPGITLEERLLYELKYFEEAGKHLDVQNVTLCAGSRGPHGYVSCMYWHNGGVRVDWDDPGSSSVGLRARAAVS